MTKTTDFDPQLLKTLYRPQDKSKKEQNGQITIIGGSDLFHGAPLLAIQTASRIVDMVFFASPEPSLEKIARFKSELSSFIYVPFDEVGEYIKKSDAVLIGPGMKRFHQEKDRRKISSKYDEAGTRTKFLTEKLLRQYSQKQWIIDAGALQVVNPALIPLHAIITPNQKEFTLLFGQDPIKQDESSLIQTVSHLALIHHCVIVYKAATAYVSDGKTTYLIKNGNPGLTKGGTGDILAALTTALVAKNPPLLSAAAASYIVKAAADDLYRKVGTFYNSDDLASHIPATLHSLLT